MTSDNAPSVLAEMVMLAPKVRTLLGTIQLPGTDPAWQSVHRAFNLLIAWTEYWKAVGDCPDVTLEKASMLTQVNSAIIEANTVSSEKLIELYPDKKEILTQLKQDGEVFSKGWVVMLYVLTGANQ